MIGKWTGNAVEDSLEIGRLVTEVERLKAELEQFKRTNNELNRRCQSYESALAEKIKTASPGSFGRALANGAATMYQAERDKLKAEHERLTYAKQLAEKGFKNIESENDKLREALEEVKTYLIIYNPHARYTIGRIDEILDNQSTNPPEGD